MNRRIIRRTITIVAMLVAIGIILVWGRVQETEVEREITRIKGEKPSVLIVDYKTDSSVRMVKCLRKAKFKVKRVGKQDKYDVEDYDALVIPGGHNVTPSLYGAERDKHTYGTNRRLDKLQIAAIKEFAAKGKPILGICRGCQIVNVALGGTINQHIPGWHKRNREITIEPESWLHDIYGDESIVWHFHHQCVETLADGLIATEWDKSDGRIEGYEHESLPIYGLQWHPDSMGKDGMPVFESFREIVIETKIKKVLAS